MTQVIKLEIDDSKLDIFMNIIQNLKENIVLKYEMINDNIEHKDFIIASEKSLEKVWDNKEDNVYDKFL